MQGYGRGKMEDGRWKIGKSQESRGTNDKRLMINDK
jgi:hypothetical protein